MTYAEDRIATWIEKASREALMDKLAELDPSNDRTLSPRDVETRAVLRSRIRAEVKARDKS